MKNYKGQLGSKKMGVRENRKRKKKKYSIGGER